ncbi:MAG: NUDIX domain-containing protein [Candidatus Buchananbacteria bacterium]
MRQTARMVVIEDGKVLLIHRIKNTEYWVFPGGGIEEGEDHQAALGREAQEELGVEIEIGEKLCEEKWQISETEEALNHFYVCKISGGKLGTGNGPEWQENSGYVGSYGIEWRSIDEISNLDLKPNSVRDLVVEKLKK